jgi:hypothetical protein
MAPFEMLRRKGLDAEGAALLARKRGLDTFTIVAMLRSTYDLSLEAAKEALVKAEQGYGSLSEYQQNLLPSLRKALETLDQEGNVYGSGLNDADWCALRDVVWPFIHADDPSAVPMPEVPDHLKAHPIVEAIRRYRRDKRDEDLDQAGQGLIPSKDPFGWYVLLTK